MTANPETQPSEADLELAADIVAELADIAFDCLVSDRVPESSIDHVLFHVRLNDVSVDAAGNVAWSEALLMDVVDADGVTLIVATEHELGISAEAGRACLARCQDTVDRLVGLLGPQWRMFRLFLDSSAVALVPNEAGSIRHRFVTDGQTYAPGDIVDQSYADSTFVE